MKKYNILIATTAILSCAILTESAKACPTGQIEDSITKHCVKVFSGCGGKCTSYYDTETHDVVVKPNPGAVGEIKLTEGDTRGRFYSTDWRVNVRNMTIEEGITALGSTSVWNFGSGTLKLPSTLNSFEYIAIYNTYFSTVDASSLRNVPDLTIGNGNNRSSTLIVSDETSRLRVTCSYESCPSNVTIQCKGNLATCQNLVRKGSNTTNLTAEYYKEYDKKGNILEEWGPNGQARYTYDAGGNLVSAYQNGKAVYLRKRYTIPEADAATQGKGPFRLDITW